MDYRIIVSPEKGFWSDHGWQVHLSEATHINSTTELVLSFKDSDVKVIRRKDIQPMTRHAFLSFLLKVCLKRLYQGTAQNGIDGLIGSPAIIKDQKILIGNTLFSLEEAERHAHSLVWARKPSAEDLAVWGRRFLQYHVAAGDHDTIYVISLSSPATVQMLPHPWPQKSLNTTLRLSSQVVGILLFDNNARCYDSLTGSTWVGILILISGFSSLRRRTD